jgi:hypothetical protein
MRYCLIIFCLFVLRLNFFSQNLVANPGFETTTGCGGNGALAQATGWNVPPGGITLADLYTPCASTGVTCSNFNPLNSMAGCSNACTGNNYTGQIAYYTACPNCREYLQRSLTSPLVAGTTYFLSFNTKLAPFARYACNRMGMYVSSAQPSQPGSNQPILVTPQIQAGQITDKVNWTTVSGTFVATGGENWVTIGVFYNNASLTIFDFGSSASGCLLVNSGAYYLVDNVWIANVNAGPAPLCQSSSTNCSVPLPIELTGFDAKYEDKIVKLNWSTSTEINNDFFTIEKSRDGENFETVKVIKESVNSNNTKNYASIDEWPYAGLSYYRLKQTDLDATFKYSDVRAVNSQNRANGLFVQPNPSENFIDIIFDIPNSQNMSLHIYDMLGKHVYKSELVTNPGFNKSRHNISELSKGIYFINLVGDETGQPVKFIKE